MKTEFQVLMIEESTSDSGLAESAARSVGLEPRISLVKDIPSLERALKERRYDMILTGDALGSFTAKDVIRLARGSCPDIPVVILTASLSDQAAADLIRSGAEDYIIKDRISRLTAVLERLTRAAYAKKREAMAERSRKMEAVGRLASGIAHDFNNVLGAVEGYATLILNGISANDPTRADIEEIRKAEQRGAALTKQLMAFSRKHSAHKAALDTAGFLGNLNKTCKQVSGGDLVLEISAASDLKPVQADAVQLEQAIMHLLTNARDAMPEGSPIKITAENAACDQLPPGSPEPEKQGTGFVKISVEDTGAGMSEATMAHLFEPFFTTKPRGKGQGFGLASVYAIAAQNNGWVEVRSEPGRGSAFTLYIPQAEVVTATAAAAPDLRGNGERVLIVENNADLRELAIRTLKANNYDPAGAASTDEAAKNLSEKDAAFSFVVIDLESRGEKSETELMATLKNASPETYFIITSNSAENKTAQGPAGKTGYTFIQKPYSIELILKTFKERLQNTLKRSR